MLGSMIRPSADIRPVTAIARPEPSRLLGRLGALEARLASSPADLDQVQALRFDIFSEEFGVAFDPASRAARRDRDDHDARCDHLMVIDTDVPAGTAPRLVGTYRLAVTGKTNGATPAYSQAEFDVARLIKG